MQQPGLFAPPLLSFLLSLFYFFSLCLKWFTEERKGLFPVLSWTQHQLPVRKARRKHWAALTHAHMHTHRGSSWLVGFWGFFFFLLLKKLGQALQCPARRWAEIYMSCLVKDLTRKIICSSCCTLNEWGTLRAHAANAPSIWADDTGGGGGHT